MSAVKKERDRKRQEEKLKFERELKATEAQYAHETRGGLQTKLALKINQAYVGNSGGVYDQVEHECMHGACRQEGVYWSIRLCVKRV